MFKFVLLSLGCFLCCKVISAQQCRTPNGQTGRCIVIKDCTQLYNMAIKIQSLTPEEIDFLRNSGCGWQDEHPKVCCPTTTAAPTSQQPSTQEHSASSLLPDLDTCGIHEANRIVGGELTGLKEFPWMVLLEYDTPSGRGFKCGGALISKRYVLTAAHCLKKTPPTWTLLSVRVGEHDLSKVRDCDDETPGFEDCADPPIDIPVEQAIAHNQYKTTSIDEHNDIALLRLRSEVTFTKYVSPICLPTSNFPHQKNTNSNMTVAGWGRTENTTFSNIKLKLDVPLVSNDECFPKYKKAGAQLWNSQFCAGGTKGKDSCKGDSGGPLMFKQDNWYIGGVVSFGPRKCGLEGFPGVYTKVIDYRNWILSNMRP